MPTTLLTLPPNTQAAHVRSSVSSAEVLVSLSPRVLPVLVTVVSKLVVLPVAVIQNALYRPTWSVSAAHLLNDAKVVRMVVSKWTAVLLIVRGRLKVTVVLVVVTVVVSLLQIVPPTVLATAPVLLMEVRRVEATLNAMGTTHYPLPPVVAPLD